MAVRLGAEVIGTFALTFVAAGGDVTANLTGGDVTPVARALAPGLLVMAFIYAIGDRSGAHFNPAVTLVFAGRGEFPWSEVAPYVVVQCLAGICGTAIAQVMFDLAPLAIGTTTRSGPSQWLSEAVATFTLVFAILGGVRHAPQAIPWLVGLTITAAYWFTSSTSFANPAVTLARGFTTTFAGIAINHVPGFIAAQLLGAAAAAGVCAVLFSPSAAHAVRELR